MSHRGIAVATGPVLAREFKPYVRGDLVAMNAAIMAARKPGARVPDTSEHGTPQGYKRHQAKREKACDACYRAKQVVNRKYKEARKARGHGDG